MARTYETDQWGQYIMDRYNPFIVLEPVEREIVVVDEALKFLVETEILPHIGYDKQKMNVHRTAVRKHFNIPWTTITPRMERLLYAINATIQPRIMVAVGIYCGYTFISNAGAAMGPGACYNAQRLIGIEIRAWGADIARRNIAAIDPDQRAEIFTADGIAWLSNFDDPIDLLYIDAGGSSDGGKFRYLDVVLAAQHALHSGSLVLAHDSVKYSSQMSDYFQYVRGKSNSRKSINMMIDNLGLEVSECI